jgi:hypothetical protein
VVVPFRPKPLGQTTSPQQGAPRWRQPTSPQQGASGQTHQPKDHLSKEAQPAARRQGKAQPKTPFPEGWELGNAELAIAQRVANWDFEASEFQFRRFRLWYREKGLPSADWSASWEKWCMSGLERANKQPGRQLTGLEEMALGAKE